MVWFGLIQIAKSKDASSSEAVQQSTELWNPVEPTLNLGTNTVIDCVTLKGTDPHSSNQ